LKFFFTSLLFTLFVFADYNKDNHIASGSDYYNDQNGDTYIFINVLGHVKSPGSYIIYEDTDILTALSIAGGYLSGAKTSKILVVPAEGKSYYVNLNEIMSGDRSEKVYFKPNDTIYVDETNINYILSKANIVNVFLQLTNLLLIASNNN